MSVRPPPGLCGLPGGGYLMWGLKEEEEEEDEEDEDEDMAS